ncbi:PHD finger protein 20-like [Aplochiton taeniatus]
MDYSETFSPKEEGLDVDRMSKIPPNRRGITFEVGAQLEARDSLKNWYAANIEKIDYDDEKVLIHYRQWSHRYDEWFDWTSPYLRPVERIQLRRQGLQEDGPAPGFHVNDKVLASWSDCRFYPAKVLSVNKDASYTVKFYDGVVQTVKGIHVKPFVGEKGGAGRGKSRSGLRNGVQNGRDRRPPENRGPKTKRARRSTSDQDEDSNTDDEDEWEEGEEEEKTQTKGGEGEGSKEKAPMVKQEDHSSQQAGHNHLRDQAKEKGLSNGVKGGEDKGGTEEVSELNGGIAARKQGFHNPNRFSREPLYRVIKNQPPPVLSINLDHNPFKCSAPGCTKSFRKAKLLHYHMKYYHGEDHPPEEDDSATRSVQTRASEKQTAAVESPKRRRTISASTHPTVHNGSGAPPSPRSEVKVSGRRTSAPPAVNTQGQQQRALLREKSKENQLDRNGCQLQTKEGEKSGFDIGLVKEKDRIKDKKPKNFLQIKLKKRKKKKKSKSEHTGSEENIDISILGLQSKLNLPHKFPLSHNHKPEAYPRRPGHSQSEQIHGNDEDTVSDWSTDSCGWSDEDFGVEVDVTTPPLSGDSVALETSDQEIVRCICEVEEENDFMIQCEECLCWQHGTCMGLLEENVPDKYACYICRDPPGKRQSLRYWYDRDWLSNGHMHGLSFLHENYSQQNAKKIAATHQLLGDVHRVVEVLSGLQLKMSLLQNQNHPDLRLWCQPWKCSERPWKSFDSCPSTNAVPSPAAPDEDMTRGEVLMSNALEKLSQAATSSSSSSSPYLSFQDSYILSEHCYQKPRAYYPAVEQRLVVETRRGSELEDSMRSTEDLLEREQRYGGLLETNRPKALGSSNKTPNAGRWAQVEVKQEDGTVCGAGGIKDCSGQQQWQINLLDHIDTVQDEVNHRMDFIERELDVLESWLDYTGELEPPEPLARLPQLKHRMKQLLSELSKVQQIALCCST